SSAESSLPQHLLTPASAGPQRLAAGLPAVLCFHPSPPHSERRYSSQLSALVVTRFGPLRELPTGSTADASFEATGDLSTWPLSLRGISLRRVGNNTDPIRTQSRTE